MYIDEGLKSELQKILSVLTKKVNIILFTQEMECRYCSETRQILSELAAINDNINLEIKDFVKNKDEADKYGVDKIPATVVLDENKKDFGIKFYGIPSGYEFSSLLETVRMIGTGDFGLDEATTASVKQIEKPVHMQVFVTPTCPYCPQAVLTAFKMAMVNPNIKAEMVEATEFPHLSQRYNVRGVPRTVINETGYLEGAAPDNMVLEKINSMVN